jgi:prolipoprotein diacylglyceryltransferase
MLGVALAFAAGRLQRDERPDLAPLRPRLLLAAVVGALLGAFLFELPADLYGWSWRPPSAPSDVLPLGGRTVLGGLLGGWLAVEAQKRRLGVTGPTGDGFALPLAVALACGRLGCAAAGCCAGVVAGPGSWWRALAVRDAMGLPRFPAPQAEALFHALAAALLLLCMRRGWLRGRRLAAYLAAYAALRCALESVRGNPALIAGLDYYQLLALALLVLAVCAWLRRGPAAQGGLAEVRAD